MEAAVNILYISLIARVPQAVAIASTGTSAWHTDLDLLWTCESGKTVVCPRDALIWDLDNVSSFFSSFSTFFFHYFLTGSIFCIEC